jgi:tRNA(Arg) A34 adenosine deaminase TadA
MDAAPAACTIVNSAGAQIAGRARAGLAYAVLGIPPVNSSTKDGAVIRKLALMTRRHFRTPNPVPFCAQVSHTRSGRTVAMALNRVVADCDPTAHAEVRAIRLACRKLGRPELSGCTLHTTCEPCPMCLTAALFAGLDRVVFGTVVRPPDSTNPPLYPYNAKDFARSSLFKCPVDGPVEEGLCRGLVDDPVVRAYIARQGKRGVFI